MSESALIALTKGCDEKQIHMLPQRLHQVGILVQFLFVLHKFPEVPPKHLTCLLIASVFHWSFSIDSSEQAWIKELVVAHFYSDPIQIQVPHAEIKLQ